MPSHQSFKVKHKMDIAIGGDPRGGPLFPPKGKGQKYSRIAPCESEKKNSFLNSIFKRKIFFFTESILKKIQCNFFQESKKNANGFPNRYQKTKRKIYPKKIFFRFSRKMKIQFLHSSKNTVKSRQQKKQSGEISVPL